MKLEKFYFDKAQADDAKSIVTNILGVLQESNISLNSAQLQGLGKNKNAYDAAAWPAIWESACNMFGLSEQNTLNQSEWLALREVCLAKARHDYKPYNDFYKACEMAGLSNLRNKKHIGKHVEIDFSIIFEHNGDSWVISENANDYIEDCCTWYISPNAKALFDFVNDHKSALTKHLSNRFVAAAVSDMLDNGRTNDKLFFAQQFYNL